jgi:hypothetical protein
VLVEITWHELAKLRARTSKWISGVRRVFGNANAILTYEKEIYMLLRRTAVCTMLFLVALGAAFAQQVKTDFDHQANFSQYKTYSWQEIKPANSLWDARIKNAVDQDNPD